MRSQGNAQHTWNSAPPAPTGAGPLALPLYPIRATIVLNAGLQLYQIHHFAKLTIGVLEISTHAPMSRMVTPLGAHCVSFYPHTTNCDFPRQHMTTLSA